MTTSRHPGLDRIQAALDEGDVQAARRALLELKPSEEALAREEMGTEAFDRARGAASRGARRGKLGKVVVLPGIMGSELDSVDRSGDADRIWINFFNLIRGRIDELALTADGKPAKSGIQVRTAGVHRATYLPLILDLDTRWQVHPFAFDWREDLELSAKRLNDEITDFAAGDPVHLVAHSMGGLVARLFAHRFPETWRAIADANAPGRGGRLIMLGTPNRGSFAIPLVLTGAEGILKALAVADIPHRMKGILAIVSSFPGLYQMLPSPSVAGAHKQLFKAAAWGAFSVHQPLLDRARDMHTELEKVVDPKRLTYVAGYDQMTPVAIRIDGPGRFSYQETLEGDGRVPHAFGLLEGSGIPTYWIKESHGDLPKNGRVMDAVSDILERGETAELPQAKPASRGVERSAWKSGEELESVPPEATEILAAARGGRSAGTPRDIGKSAEIRLENLLLADYLGTGDDAARAVVSAPGGPRRPGGPPSPPKRRQAQTIHLEVVWGDVTQVRADVYCVGHYQGVLPQNAELALDRALSGAQQPDEPDEVYRRRLVITQYTRRGLLDGTLGDVRYFPWKLARENSRIVAVAGMGRPGTFNVQGLRRVANELAFEIGSLPMVETVCTVLIGSGEGSLSIREAVDGLLGGLRDAVSARGERWIATLPRKLTIVERDRDRANEIARAIEIEVPTGVERLESPVRAVRLVCNAGPVPGPGRAISDDDALALLLDSAIAATGKPKSSRHARALSVLVDDVSLKADERRLLRSRIAQAGESLRDERSPDARPTRFRVERRTQRAVNDAIPVRISFWGEGTVTKVAAITQATTVSERVISVDVGLIDELVDAMTNPLPSQVERLSALLSRLLIPHDFRDTLETGPFVFEVDRAMARVQWEFLVMRSQPNGEPEPIAVNTAVARQLRTVYSPAPRPPERPRRDLRALVIGDPGDPANGDDLEHARAEALTVCDLLRERHVEVTARIGAPSVPRIGPLHGIAPADRLDVLGLLLEGGFDIIHYAGHGNFDADRPDRAGWVFSSGLLTPHELERVDQIPAIVVANACLSARTSRALAGKRPGKDSPSEAGLLPSLADEFFRLGVRNYIGTAWEVNDIGAQLFAEHFYDALLPTGQDEGTSCSFGEAVRRARRALWEKRNTFGPLWAAYQHYGDPTSEARITGDVQTGDAAPS